jgi:hypothetical protein
MLFQQITGQPSVLYYAARIFQDAGFPGAQEATGVRVFDALTTALQKNSMAHLPRRRVPRSPGGSGVRVFDALTPALQKRVRRIFQDARFPGAQEATGVRRITAGASVKYRKLARARKLFFYKKERGVVCDACNALPSCSWI